MKKLVIMLVMLIGLLPRVSAHCPLCTVGAGAGVAVARFYGVHDIIVGLFLGAVIVSSALWFSKWVKSKINFILLEALIVVGTFLTFGIPFYYTGLITKTNVVKLMPETYSIFGFGALGVDSLLFGMILGSIVVWGAFSFSEYIKKKKGKVLFPYQGVTFMLGSLMILAGILWLVV